MRRLHEPIHHIPISNHPRRPAGAYVAPYDARANSTCFDGHFSLRELSGGHGADAADTAGAPLAL
jgi:hypothetical protein